MTSIHSVLIQTCMANIHKEISQLEHWLITLPNQGVPVSDLPHSNSPIATLASMMERLSKQFDVQQHALNHIVDRLDILERDRNQDESEESAPNDYLDPWLDSSHSPLQNEIIDVLPQEPIYTVHKTETLFEPPFIAPVSALSQEKSVQPKETNESVEEKSHVVVSPIATNLPVEEKVVEQADEMQENETQENKTQADEEHADEDEGLELDTIEFKGTSYYRDEEGFIYGIMDDDQPSETAIGLWKEKLQTIKFYRTS